MATNGVEHILNNELVQKLMKSDTVHIVLADEEGKIIFNPSNFDVNDKMRSVEINGQEYCRSHEHRYYKCIREEIEMDGKIYNKITYADDTALIEYGRSRMRMDKKTNVLNNEGFMILMNEMISNLGDKKCYLAMLDMDNFKSLNDNYGHVKGDSALIKFARFLKDSFRAEDIVGRFGGDEFIVAAQNLTQEQFTQRLEFIRQLVEMRLEKYGITMTAGVTEYDTNLTYEQNKHNADVALYYGKQKGKNIVSVYDKTMELQENAPLKKDTPHEEEIR